MDVSAACDDSFSKHLNNRRDLMQSFANYKQQCSKSNAIEDSAVTELVNSEQDQIWHPDEGKVFEDLPIHDAKSSALTTQMDLTKCATYPGSTFSLIVDVREESTDTKFHGQNSMISENPVCTRSISLPAPLKLVSAMKGSREKQGTPPKKLTVKWAPDVYDPPTTSLSHTVKSHNQQRFRASKKNGKQKHKGKSSRGSNNDKKHHRKYIGNAGLCSKAPSTTYDRLLFGGSPVEQMEFAVTAQDSKCGGGFLQASFAKMHISVAEAT